MRSDKCLVEVVVGERGADEGGQHFEVTGSANHCAYQVVHASKLKVKEDEMD